MDNGWISVKDKLPDNMADVLVYISEKGLFGIGYYNSHDWYCYGMGYRIISHWQPLPEPPQERK